MRHPMNFMLSLLFAVSAGVPAYAADISVTNAWFRALPGGLPAGGYFSLKNSGASPVILTGAESAACGMLMMHQSSENGGVSRMDDVRSLSVPADGSITFAPGGYHLMCMNPAAAMAPGKTVEVTLNFANGTHIKANFAVRNAAGK
ncbi:MAG TPA: copper chaperone PCu(A)C [Rhizomicrobium sp.]|nr:copper chaperone PCu(A)C [Rhizomicrobium sp.]